jgi:hypothetical protein
LVLALGAAAVLAASFAGFGVRVAPGDFTRAQVLLPGMFAVCACLALASTALGGLRRALIPAILATGWAAMAHGHAASWVLAQQRFALARAEVSRALLMEPRPAALLLIDVPVLVSGFAPLDAARPQSFLSAPEIQANDATELARLRELKQPRVRVHAPSRAAATQFAHTQAGLALREAGLALALDGAGGRALLRLPKASPTSGSRRWFRDGASTALDWEALSIRGVSARGTRETDLSRAPFLGWNASGIDGQFTQGEIQGVWIDYGSEPRVHFDVGASLEWNCSDRVLLAWPVEGWSNISEAEGHDELANFDPPPVPEVRGDDWRLQGLESSVTIAAQTTLARRGASGEWRLLLCNLHTLEQLRLELQPSAAQAGDWIAHGAGRVASAWTRQGHEFAWSVEYSALGIALVREQGLVRAAPGTSR